MQFAGVNFAARAVDGEVIAFVEDVCRRPYGLRGVIDLQRAGAADANLAHLPGDQRRVRTDTAAGGENAFGGDHAAQIFRRSFDADEQNLFAFAGGFDGAIGVEINLAGGRAGTGRQTRGDDLRQLSTAARSKTGASTWSSWSAGTRVTAVFQSISFSFTISTGEPHSREAGAFAVAGLEHEHLAFLDGELEVLHVLEMRFESLADLFQFGESLRQMLFRARPPARECERRRRRLRPGR